MTAGHRTVRYLDERGYIASCPCGWRATRRTRELRDQDADAHELSIVDVLPRQGGAR